MEQKFYICKHCGNIVELIQKGGGVLVCCEDEMKELVPNSTEAANEKHVPEIIVYGSQVIVNVGAAPHPMTEQHYIGWICIRTTKGVYRKDLAPLDEPTAAFALAENENIISAYAYCNLHGLWKNDKTTLI